MNISYKYSIIIPTFNDNLYDFDILLNSISSNKRNDVEIIVVDDSDKDFRKNLKNSIEKHQEKIVTIFNDFRQGLSYSCNQGIQISKGEYLIFLNCDNFINDDFFDRIDILIKKGHDFIATKNRVINIDDEFGLYINKIHVQHSITGADKEKFKRKKNVSYTEGCVVKKELVLIAGGFLDWNKNNLKAGEDLIFADKIRPYSKNPIYASSIIVKHSIPNTNASFFYNRFIRGYGTIQMYRFYRGLSIFKICSLFIFRNLLNIFKLLTIVYPLIYLHRLINADYKKIKKIYINFLKVYYLEKIAIIYGEFKSLISIIKLQNTKIERVNLNNLSKKQKILFVNPASEQKYSNIKEALIFNNCNFDEIYASPNFSNYYQRTRNIKYFIRRFFEKIGLPIDFDQFNKKLFLKIIKSKYELVIIGKVNFLKPNTIKKIKSFSTNSKIVSWVDDNMTKMHNSSHFFLKALKYYDLIVSVKRDKIYEKNLKSRINKNAKLFLTLPSANRKINIKNNTKPFNKNLCFVGFGDKERFNILHQLSKNYKIDIYGSGWDRFNYRNNKNFVIKNKTLPYNHNFIISEYIINLNIPRSSNNDWANYKLIELMASNIFAIHKYSIHLEKYFKEGESIVTFKNMEELLKKINYYNQNKDKTLEIRENSFKIIKKLDLYYDTKLKDILEKVL
tara:strand:- start:155 stop:2182 length:2028 start_codon:yes stop_codon:yes gene_type:complete